MMLETGQKREGTAMPEREDYMRADAEETADSKDIETDGFQFHYSANGRRERNTEVERIRNQYQAPEQEAEPEPLKPEEDKLERLKRLDAKAKQPAVLISIATGMVGTLVLGIGMSLILAFDMMVLGIIIGVPGMGIMGSAVPIHQYFLRKGKERYGAEILQLSEELLKEE